VENPDNLEPNRQDNNRERSRDNLVNSQRDSRIRNQPNWPPKPPSWPNSNNSSNKP